jgi:hypothetical protein
VLNSGFVESQSCVIKLVDEDPLVVGIFITFIHSRCFYDSTAPPEALLSARTLVDLFVFADAHDSPIFQNAVVDVIIKKIRRTTEIVLLLDLCTYAASDTLTSSALWMLVVDLACCLEQDDGDNADLNHDDVSKVMEIYEELARGHRPVDCLRTGLKSFRSKASSEWYCKHWHVHAEGETC